MNNETTNTIRNNSTADFNFEISEVEVKGITLKGIKMSAHVDITDEHARISTDGQVGIFKMLLQFADEKINKLIDADIRNNELRTESRLKTESAQELYYQQQTKTEEARAAKYDAETEKIEAERKHQEEVWAQDEKDRAEGK